MMEETIAGPASSKASHCALKSGSTTLPASGGDRRAPIGEEIPHRRFRGGVALGRRIGNPQIELKAAVSAGPHVGRPIPDRFRLHHERAAAAEATRIGNGDGERR
jgi:hypothetical protein